MRSTSIPLLQSLVHLDFSLSGPWSPEEEQLLAAAVAQLRGEDWTGGDAELPHTATWEDVARCVKTRTAIQCWNKWYVRGHEERGG